MADTRSATDRDSARNRAQKHFTASEERDSQIKHLIESERASRDAKTAKLRALRLAKEEADRAAGVNAPIDSPKPRARKPRSKAV